MQSATDQLKALHLSLGVSLDETLDLIDSTYPPILHDRLMSLRTLIDDARWTVYAMIEESADEE